MPGDEAAIRELLAEWKGRTGEGDVEALLAMVTDDVVFLTPGNPPIDRAKFKAGFRQVSAKSRVDVVQEIHDLRTEGDFGYCWSYLRVTVTPKAGGHAVHTEGHVLSVFRREGGRWKIARDANLMPQAGNPDKT